MARISYLELNLILASALQQRDWNKDEIATELSRRKITHIVATAHRAISCDALILVYADEHYRLYRLRLP